MSWFRSPSGRKMVKYAVVSVVSTLASQGVLLLTFGVWRLWSAVVCNVVANAVATIPSYYLNRSWVWGKSGRSHLLREVTPFWITSFAGMALSLYTVWVAAGFADHHDFSHVAKTAIVQSANLVAFGVLWVAKFVFYNRVLFVQPEAAPVAEMVRASDAPNSALDAVAE